VWLVPLAVVLMRLALDPLDNGYYFVGVVGPALVGLAAFVSAQTAPERPDRGYSPSRLRAAFRTSRPHEIRLHSR
jgi:hypothetical protein